MQTVSIEAVPVPHDLPAPHGPARGPTVLEVHPGRACPLRCTFCYRQGQVYDVDLPPLSEREWPSLLASFKQLGGQRVYISGGLEPLTAPQSVRTIIRRARQLNLGVRLYTSGMSRPLEFERLREDLARCEQVRFSVPAASEETYRRIMRPARQDVGLHTVVDNVRSMLAVRDFRQTGCQVGTSILVLEQNADELPQSLLCWRNMGVDFVNVRVDVCAEEQSPRVRNAVAAVQRDLATGSYHPMQVDLPLVLSRPAPHAARCYVPLEKLVVDPFGVVFTCCLLAHPGHRPAWARLGNLRRQSFAEIVDRVRHAMPRPHCAQCTPFETEFNRIHEAVNAVQCREASASILQRPPLQ